MKELKQQIVKTGKKLGKKGLSPGYSGNISTRYGRYFLISPSGLPLDDLKEDDVVLIDENLKIIDGKKKPSSEAQLHIEIYKKRHDINAIIHCHAPKASAFAVSETPLSLPILTESILHFGKTIPVAKYHLFSTPEVAQETAQYFDKNDVVLMQNHGVVLGGKDLKDAYYRIDTVEYTAEVILYAKLLGTPKELTPDEIQEIEDLRLRTKEQ